MEEQKIHSVHRENIANIAFVFACKRGIGAPEKIRTSDLQLRRLPLYPAELRARNLSVA
jgi:hypothetical protein